MTLFISHFQEYRNFVFAIKWAQQFIYVMLFQPHLFSLAYVLIYTFSIICLLNNLPNGYAKCFIQLSHKYLINIKYKFEILFSLLVFKLEDIYWHTDQQPKCINRSSFQLCIVILHFCNASISLNIDIVICAYIVLKKVFVFIYVLCDLLKDTFISY